MDAAIRFGRSLSIRPDCKPFSGPDLEFASASRFKKSFSDCFMPYIDKR